MKIELVACNVCAPRQDGSEVILRATKPYEIMTEVGPVHVDLCEDHRKPLDAIVGSAIGTGGAPTGGKVSPAKRAPRKASARRKGGTPIMTEREIEEEKQRQASARVTQ